MTTGSFLTDLMLVMASIVVFILTLVGIEAALNLTRWLKRRRIARMTGR